MAVNILAYRTTGIAGIYLYIGYKLKIQEDFTNTPLLFNHADITRILTFKKKRSHSLINYPLAIQ